MKVVLKIICCLFIIFISTLSFSCDRKTFPANPNSLPNTTLANIPVEGDTLFALVTLHWDGEDYDGFIAGYQYRYITYHLFFGDSVVQEWKETNETSLTIAFESSDSLNYQKFQVRAVDNVGDVDPTPAEKYFYTRKTVFPETEVLTPEENDTLFVIEQTTDWWLGIQLSFRAWDNDGEVAEYAWIVDNSDTTWTQDTTLYITPDRFSRPLEGKHIIRVTSRDNTNLIDPFGDSVMINLIKPTFEQKILIIDETIESSFPLGVSASDADVDSFYAEIFHPDSTWDYNKHGMPPKNMLGQYQLIIWHADNIYSEAKDYHRLPDHIDDIMDYLNVGGDLIMSGWRILKSFAPTENFPRSFGEGTFIHDYLHIITVDETVLYGDFTGAIGVGPFSDITVDSVKLAEAFPYFGKLAQINIIPARAGFTDITYSYENDIESPYTDYRGKACGLRYYGTVFDVVVLGFPIYFIKENDARIMAKEILESLGY